MTRRLTGISPDNEPLIYGNTAMIAHLKITVDGKSYDVTVEHLGAPDDRPASAALSQPVPVVAPHSSPAVSSPASASSAAPGEVVSPLAGKLVSIDVSKGDRVAANQQVATIEAMKMNTQILASSGGTVLEIFSAVGDAVEEGQVLMKIG